jgi:phospholipid/cholesterol/gamma-HCH transport system substrate-binding protein
MQYHSREIKAGLLVVGSLIVLLIFLVTITKVDWRKTENEYTARFGYIGGIEAGSMVRYGGFLVGTVTDLYLAPDDNTKLEVLLSIDSRTPVRKSSEALITSISLMGEYYIEITPGVTTDELLPPGGILRTRDVPSFSRMSEPLMNVSDQMTLLLERSNDLLSDENRRRFSNILAHADTLVSVNADDIAGMISNLNALTLQMQSLSMKLDRIMGDNTANLQTTFAQMNQTMARADTVLNTLNQTMGQLHQLVTSNSSSLQETLANFESASHNFEQFSRTIKERPWNLIRKSAPPERELP